MLQARPFLTNFGSDISKHLDRINPLKVTNLSSFWNIKTNFGIVKTLLNIGTIHNHQAGSSILVILKIRGHKYVLFLNTVRIF